MLGDFIKSGDFKGEKHVPVIVAPDKVKKGEWFEIEVSVGKEIPHPNTVEHYIAWIELFFMPEGGQFLQSIGRYNFSPVVQDPFVRTRIRLEKSGKLIAIEMCNIHGLWESSKEIVVEE